MYVRVRVVQVLLALSVVTAGLMIGQQLQAQTAAPASDPLVAVRDADPLELARVASRLGDAAVVSRLTDEHPVEVRLAAIRTTPFLRAPEQALPWLSALVSVRDGVLAQAAARALVRIVSALDMDVLARREVAPVELVAVRKELERAAAVEHLRADLRSMASAAASMLAGLGVPSAN